MRKILQLLTGMLILCKLSYSQEPYNIMEFAQEFRTFIQAKNDSIFIVGENHFKHNLPHKIVVFQELYLQKGIHRIGIEAPKSFEILCNNYLHTGDETIFGADDYKGILKKEFEGLLKEIRNFNKTIADDSRRISVFCYDMPSLYYNSTGATLKYTFSTIPGIERLPFFKSILDETHIYSSYEALEAAKRIRLEMIRQDTVYTNVLGQERYKLLKLVVEGMELSYQKDFSFKLNSYELREAYLLKNVLPELTRKEGVLIFCGNAHASVLPRDTIYFNGQYWDSFGSIVSRMFPGNVCSVTTQYLRKGGGISGINLLGKKRICSTRKDSDKYWFLDDEELKDHLEASKRCDAVIVVPKY